MQAKVKAGVSTFSLGGVSLAAYVLAIVAFVQGARDEATISAAAIGTVALVTMAAGRFWQAVAKIHNPTRPIASSLSNRALADEFDRRGFTAKVPVGGTMFSGQTRSAPRPSAGMTAQMVNVGELGENDDPDLDWTRPDQSIADPALDDPGDVPTREKHSRLKG